MQNYAKLTEDKSTYVLDVLDNCDDESLTVIFADKKKHEDVENTPENIKKFEEQMENQMDDAIKREPLYVFLSILATGSVVAVETGTVILKGMESLQSTEIGQFLTGTFWLVGTGISTLWCIREYSRVSELSTVKYRNKHAEKLQNIGRYKHALDSSSDKIRHLVAENDNPLGILNIDQYKKSDLKKIVKEINREEALLAQGITYVKTK